MAKPILPRNRHLTDAMVKANKAAPPTYVPFKERWKDGVKGRLTPSVTSRRKKHPSLPKLPWDETVKD